MIEFLSNASCQSVSKDVNLAISSGVAFAPGKLPAAPTPKAAY
jgi:hypothetical protein